MKQTGTTKKHAGGGKHHAGGQGGAKHHPHHMSAHEKKLRAADRKKAHQHAVGHAGKAGKSPKAAKAKQLALGADVACCSAEALAASLRLSGWSVTDADVLALYRLAAPDDDHGATIEAVCVAAQSFGLAGVRLERFWPARPHASEIVLGLTGPDHAVLATPEGWWSWGFLLEHCFLPYTDIDEAWELRWAL